jgi:hypothetical protein
MGLDDGDARAVAAELGANTTLTELNLGMNSIGAAGAASLAAVLENNSALTTLSLDRNSIGAAGAASLAEVLKVNTTLTGLNLCINLISDEGAWALAEALEVNTALTELNLEENDIRKVVFNAIENATKANPCALVPLTKRQRMAFFTGHLRRPSQQSPLTRLPLDMVRRILTQYSVAQGRRVWDDDKMRICLPGEENVPQFHLLGDW